MLRVKLGIASVLAMLTACCAVPPGVSAEFKLTEESCKNGKKVNLCYENTSTKTLFVFVGTEEFEILPFLGEQHILFEWRLGVTGEPIDITCKGVDAEHTEKEIEKESLLPDGLILQPSPFVANTLLEFQLNLLECKIEGSLGNHCKVPASVITTPLVGEFDELPVGSKPPFADDEITFKPREGTLLVEFTITNNGAENCPTPVAGKKMISGSVLCFFDQKESEALEDLVEHELICDPARGGQEGKLYMIVPEFPVKLLAELEIFLLGVKEGDPWSVSNEA